MEEIAISKFKATRPAVLESGRRTRRPVLVTRLGKPVADVVPPSAPTQPTGWLGSLRTTGQIRGAIVSPATDARDWDALRS